MTSAALRHPQLTQHAPVHSGRYMAEWVKYSAYGVPFGLPGGDTNSDGDNDAADATQIQTWINGGAYDVRGDVDLDGDVDSTDKTLAQGAPIGGSTLGNGCLYDDNLQLDVGFSGGHHLVRPLVLNRGRVLNAGTGGWVSRDPLEYIDGLSLYAYVANDPLLFVDPYGRAGQDCGYPNFDGGDRSADPHGRGSVDYHQGNTSNEPSAPSHDCSFAVGATGRISSGGQNSDSCKKAICDCLACVLTKPSCRNVQRALAGLNGEWKMTAGDMSAVPGSNGETFETHAATDGLPNGGPFGPNGIPDAPTQAGGRMFLSNTSGTDQMFYHEIQHAEVHDRHAGPDTTELELNGEQKRAHDAIKGRAKNWADKCKCKSCKKIKDCEGGPGHR